MLLSNKNLKKRSAHELIHEFYDLPPVKRYFYYWRNGFVVSDVFKTFAENIVDNLRDLLTGIGAFLGIIKTVLLFMATIIFFPVFVTIMFFSVNKQAHLFIEAEGKDRHV